MQILDARQTAQALPWHAMVAALRQTLGDEAAGRVQAPERWVLPVAPGTSWFLMPAWLAPEAGDLAAIKLITYAAGNAARGLPAILGDVLVMRASTGERLALLDGPTVTARRTAAVTLLAAQQLAACPQGPLLLIGTGVQARSHLQALVAGGGVREVWVRGRTPQRSRDFVQALQADTELARSGLQIRPADDLDAALRRCPLVVTATPAQAVCLAGPLHPDAFVAAIGAFTPQMIELAPALTRQLAASGRVVIDSPAARHEAGDLLAAGLTLHGLPTLAEALAQPRSGGSVLFKSCGAALWDLAAARCAVGA
jgi:ornithine cyclodeaminase